MSGIEALSLAANIIQIIDFACEATRLCKYVYQNGKIDSQLDHVAISLRLVAKEAQDHHAALTYTTQTDLRLEETASKCLVAARELDEEIIYLQKGSKQGNLAATLRVAVKVNWRRRRLERLEANLAKYQGLMQTQLLNHLCKEHDAISLSQRAEFGHLDATLQQLITAHVSGQTKIVLRVRKEAVVSRRQAAAQSHRVEKSIRTHITRTSANLERSFDTSLARHSTDVSSGLSQRLESFSLEKKRLDQRKSVLHSLKFPEMNERVNRLEDAHDHTFNWIFDKGPDDQSDFNDEPLPYSTAIDDSLNVDRTRSFPVRGWDNFAEWLRSEGQMYWISGLPGSGKSTLIKFLVSSEATIDALNTWRPQTTLLHHFFWKPGNNLQNTVIGMLCSLLHQLLSHMPSALDVVCDNRPSLLLKATCSDWSFKELRTLILMLLQEFSPVCIFVDGLDEASEPDYGRSLLDLLELLSSLPNVKVCAASRPEPLLRRRLESRPHLRLQDLTAGDLIAFTDSIFEPISSKLDSAQAIELRTLTGSLVHKADGVFLWLRLAVNGMLRDLEHGYSIKELQGKNDQLPKTLTALYLDMWSRLNDDKAENYRTGAEIFNLVIDFKSYADMLWSGLPSWMSTDHSDPMKLHLADILAMTDPEMQAKMSVPISFTKTDIDRRLDQAARQIETHCAGLLSVSASVGDSGRLEPHAPDSCVDFIHRTAYDFLVDTEEGQHIRNADPASPESRCLRLLRGLVASSRDLDRPLIQLTGVARALIWFIPALREADKAAVLPSSNIVNFLEDCFDSLHSGHFADTERWPTIDRTALYCICVAMPAFHGFIRTVFSRLPSSVQARTATTVLLHIRSWWLPCLGSRPELDWMRSDYELALARDLLQYGASPYQNIPVVVSDHFPEEQDWAIAPYSNAAADLCQAVIGAWKGEHSIWRAEAVELAPAAVRSILRRTVGTAEELKRLTHIKWRLSYRVGMDETKHRAMTNFCWELDRVMGIENDENGENVENDENDRNDDGYYGSYELIVEANMAYLLRAVALRTLYHESGRSDPSAHALGDLATGLTQVEPLATAKYIIYDWFGKHWRVNSGKHTRELQESINQVAFSAVAQSDATDQAMLDQLQLLLASTEVERVHEPIWRLVARERAGWISRADWEEELQKRTQQEEEVG